MTPEEFIAKWQANTRNERAACQEHFIDLCHLLDEPTPNSDPTGEDYAFEKGATKFTGERWLGRCLAAQLLRLGIQEAARRPGRRASPAAALCRAAGQSAAAGGLRHRPDRHPHQLDQRGHRDARNPAGGADQSAAAAAAEMGVLGSRAIAPGTHAPGADRAGGGGVRRTGAAAAGARARRRRRWRISSTAWCSACSPTTWACCPPGCSIRCWRWRAAARRGPRATPASCSPRWRPAAARSASSMSPGSTAACSTTPRRCRWNAMTSIC